MDANQIFNSLINQIENSKLNYSVTKTPFSATISLKCSFIKRFINSATNEENIKLETTFNAKKDDESGIAIEQLREENNKLKATVNNLEETVSTQRVALDGKFKQAKENSKAAEDQVAVFRAELIQIKKEKSKLSAKLKVVEDENVQFKENTTVLKQEVKDLEKEVIHKTKLQEADRKNFEREKVSFKQ